LNLGHVREGVWIDIDFLQCRGPHLVVKLATRWSDDVGRKSSEEEVGGGDMAEPENGEGVL